MAIPPFPGQDLAKLVLGYLAEEQLMTAYDEFLQTSPYLDAFKNEYDRLLMTSLKNIVAEYRAVKIYVETCKPFLLRKKLCQCSNLLEIFKYLVKNTDMNKLYVQETSNASKQTLFSKSNQCDVCKSLNLSTCMCRSKTGKLTPKIYTTPENVNDIEDSVETTSLADLPGNSVTDRKNNLYPEATLSQTSTCECVTNTTSKIHNVQSNFKVEQIQTSRTHQIQHNISNTPKTLENILVKSDESREKMEEFNTILNLVCSNNTGCVSRSSTDTQSSISKPICNAGTFHEFATGVSGTGDKENPIVPDSSTSENFNSWKFETRENRINILPSCNKAPTKAQLLYKVGTANNPHSKDKETSTVPHEGSAAAKEKSENSKITILSDVKFDKTFKCNKQVKMPAALKQVIPAPLLQMQTIVINGTPAYKQKAPTLNFSYTKDEIMAMPTIILVPSSGTTQNTSATCYQNNMTRTTSTTTTTSATRLLGPLVIDVPSSDGVSTSNAQTLPELVSSKAAAADGLIKTIDLTTHASLPKDANMTVAHKTSTPNAVPPTRKSSSTPRRNSHVRVLDFATPRRILHETIDEEQKDPNEVAPAESTTNDKSVTVHTNIVHDNDYKSDKPKLSNTSMNVSTSKTKVKHKNWDADLRALACGHNNYEETLPSPKEKRKKAKKKKKSTIIVNNVDTPEVENIKKSIPKSKKSVGFVGEQKKEENKIVECDSVATFTECKNNAPEVPKVDQSEIKSDISQEKIDTPEAERLSLQNVIGAKFNISELLETPYKQALCDIQMETPKFLGLDLPDEPVSDIKIMNIPTPRFLETPKPLQATPSTYSSRPTDYSSGGSYYKPDDQDYTPSSEVLQCAVTIVENKSSSPREDTLVNETKDKVTSKSNRPQRKCTRNVSYRSSPCCKTKEDEVFESASVSSETSNRSTRDKKGNKSTHTKQQLKSSLKSDTKLIITHKSPLKKEAPKKFMRIRPRRPTPPKESPRKGRKKKTCDLSEFISSKSSSKKRAVKDNSVVTLPAVAAVSTKSRRKSSTPRKLHCTEISSPDNTDKNSCDSLKRDENRLKETNASCLQDTGTEQRPLGRPGDDPQKVKPKDQPISISLPEEEDITKIKEYIETSEQPKAVSNKHGEESFQNHLIRRGFDSPTAKSIERVLLDNTPLPDGAIQSTIIEEKHKKKLDTLVNDCEKVISNHDTCNNLSLVYEENEIEEVELSVCDCNAESKNFIMCQFDETKFVPNKNISKLKDKFSMELCIEDDVSIRLRATAFTCSFNLEPDEFDHKETEAAVNSISCMDKLYTPLKDFKTQCQEVFDSTLTSLDTPVKKDDNSELTVTEICSKIEIVELKEKIEPKKRKRAQSGNTDDSLNKKVKPDTQYLLNSTNIQNIDIESVLSKLHGP